MFNVLLTDYHIELFGYLQAKTGKHTVKDCDDYIVRSSLYDPIKHSRPFEVIVSPGCERVNVFRDANVFTIGFQNKYCSMHIIQNSYIICVVHLPSKLHNDDTRRELLISEMVNEISLFIIDPDTLRHLHADHVRAFIFIIKHKTNVSCFVDIVLIV